MLPSALLTASASRQAEFSELNLHGLLPCCGRAGLTPARLHQGVSPSHLRFLLFHAFPSAITMPARVKNFFVFFCSLFSFSGTQPHSLRRVVLLVPLNSAST